MDLADPSWAAGGLGAIVAAAVGELVRRCVAVLGRLTEALARAEALADQAESLARQASAALEDLAEAAIETGAMSREARDHFARMALTADVVDGALEAWAPDATSGMEPDRDRPRRGQRARGVTK